MGSRKEDDPAAEAAEKDENSIQKAEKKEKKRKRKEEKKEKKGKRKKTKDQEDDAPVNGDCQTETSSSATDDKDKGNNSTDPSLPLDDDTSKGKQDNEETLTTVPTQQELQSLEHAYQQALEAFKADKTSKDLRRARTAAKRAWDAAIVASAQQQNANAEALVCRNCSHVFCFDAHEEFEARGWKKPTQCKHCTYTIDRARSDPKSRNRRDKKQNMCYDFQRLGVCSRGERCKFSHAQDHIGKTRPLKPICFAFAKGETCPHGEGCRFRHEHDASDNTEDATDVTKEGAVKATDAVKT